MGFAIREHSIDDVDAFYEAIEESRQHVSPWMDWLTPEFSRQNLADWVEECRGARLIGSAYEFLIVDEDDDGVVGACGLNTVIECDRRCNLGYWVRRTRLGEGAALAAVHLLRDYGFQKFGLNRIEIVVATGNEPSLRVARASGAIDEGVQRARLCVRGVAHDARMFALINPELG